MRSIRFERGSAAISESVRHAPSREPECMVQLYFSQALNVAQAHERLRHLLPAFHVWQEIGTACEAWHSLSLRQECARLLQEFLVCGIRIGRRIMARVPFPSPDEISHDEERHSPRCHLRLPTAEALEAPLANPHAGNAWVHNAGRGRPSFGKSLHDFLRSDGNFINSHSDGIVDRVGNCGHDRQQGALTDFGAKRARYLAPGLIP